LIRDPGSGIPDSGFEIESQEPKAQSPYVVGDHVSLLVARRDRLIRLAAILGAEPLRAWQLEVDPGATPAQLAMLDFWLAHSGISGRAG
jgi:hypothetical protein